MSNETTLLHTRALTTGYTFKGRHRAVSSGLHLDLKAGELVCLLGPNGAGKSTLLRTLAGMQPVLRGTVEVNSAGNVVAVGSLSAMNRARCISVVLTERPMPGMMRAEDLVALGRYPYTGRGGKLSATDREVIARVLAEVGAENLAQRFVSELSDGERQKVLIARALAQETRIILLDEPTAFLDLPRRIEIMAMLRELARRTRRAILLSTHDLDVAMRTADRIWLMEIGGHVEVGMPETLALHGSIGRIFSSEGVTFDARTGSFRPVANTFGEVSVEGEGIATHWTARALVRNGIAVTKSEGVPRVVVIDREGSPVWVVAGDEVETLDDAVARTVALVRNDSMPHVSRLTSQDDFA